MAGWVVVGLGPGSQAAEAQPLGLVPGWHVGLFLAGSPPGEPSSHPLPRACLFRPWCSCSSGQTWMCCWWPPGRS